MKSAVEELASLLGWTSLPLKMSLGFAPRCGHPNWIGVYAKICIALGLDSLDLPCLILHHVDSATIPGVTLLILLIYFRLRTNTGVLW